MTGEIPAYDPFEPLLKPGEAADIIHVNIRTLAVWANNADITAFFTVGGHRRYVEREIRALAARRARERPGESEP
jgi:predicted site-specific integrase-resolvase